MKKRDIIGVICPCIDGMTSEIIKGISVQALESGTDIAVFSIFSETENEDKNRRCEENIYSLINFDMLSGVIFLEAEFWSERLRNKITDILREKCSVPIITTGSFSEKNSTVYGIPSFNYDGAYDAVSHLIEEHRCEKIYFLAGPEGNSVSDERIRGYFRAMKAHDLPAEKNNVFYGDFWTEAAVKLAERIASGNLKAPQAVVCANDVMACSLANALILHNISVPDDIKVTGFDGSEMSLLNSPCMATYFPPLAGYGADLFRRLRSIIDKKIYSSGKLKGVFLAGKSCGCCSPECEPLVRTKKNILERNRKLSYIEHSDIYESYSSVGNLEEFICAVDHNSYLLPDYEHMFICLGKNDHFAAIYNENTYPEKMTVMLDKIEFVKVCRNISFRTHKMLPALAEDNRKPDIFFFLPVQFCGKNFGYSVFTFQNKNDVPDKSYERWIRELSRSLFMISRHAPDIKKDQDEMYDDVDIRTADIAPKWIFELIREMKKPENFTVGLPRMLMLSHVSSEHLSRVFKKYTGVTPTAFVNDLRLEYAASLISEEKYDITDACFVSGFSNLSHFYHLFSKKYGCSPKKYTNKSTEGD